MTGGRKRLSRGLTASVNYTYARTYETDLDTLRRDRAVILADGGVRPDVAAIHGDQFRTAGFALTVQGLAAGTYDLAVFPWSTVTGAFAPPNVVRVTARYSSR